MREKITRGRMPCARACARLSQGGKRKYARNMAQTSAFVSNLLVCKKSGRYAIIASEGETMTNANHEEQRELNKLRIARRSMMYIVRTLLLIIMASMLCIGAFMTAERYSNLYILTSEGMALRAECVLADGARNDLEEYFTLTFLENDPAMSDATYANYTITDYNYDLAIEKISVLPWSMSATVTATERVSLKGNINADQLGEDQNPANFPLPRWEPKRYKIKFLNTNARWYISELTVIEENPDASNLGTPDPNMSPIPAATPTPKPTEAP
jgi:hypothetical protein